MEQGSGGGHSPGGPAYGVPTAAGADGSLPSPGQGGFDWADAGVGAGMAVAAVLIAAGAAGLARTKRKLAHS